MSRCTEMLDQIAEEAKRIGINVKEHTYPGATQRQIADAVGKLPFQIPPEVLELFLWRNGVRLAGQASEIRIFPRFVWRSIDLSVKTSLKLISASNDPEVRWRKTWYCLATDLAGDYYALDADRAGENYGRIFVITCAADPYPAFWSFEAMLASVLECYRMRAYFLDESGELTENREMSDTIYRAINNGLSPHRLESKQHLIHQVKRAKERFEREGRSDLLQKLRELSRSSDLNIEDL